MRSLSIVILALAALCLSAPAFAANSGQLEVQFSGTITNPCNGETVAFGGTVHIDSTVTINGNTAHLTSHANPQGVTGVGETTSAKYQANGVTRQDLQGSLVNGSVNFAFINRFDFMGRGSVPNFSVHETAHITVNANGTITASFDNFSATCH
jgi:type 1 fimbria pilin